MRIAVIGAGPAGIEAALAARAAGADFVTLFSREADLPYSRPRIIEAAFTDGDVTPFAMHPREWYSKMGINLRLDTPVTALDTENRILQTPDGDEAFDAFVLAGGANPLKPIIPGLVASPSIYTLWSSDSVRKLSKHAKRGRVVAIIGGGTLGIEAALSAAKAKKQVILFEKGSRLMENWLDKEASDVIADILVKKGVDIRFNSVITSAQQIASKLCLRQAGSAKSVDVDMVVLTVGAKANLALAQSAGLTVDRGICVDETLQTSAVYVYAAGDCAQFGITNHCCVPSAIEQGRIAGFNAVASVNGAEPKICPINDFPLHLKTDDIEVHAWGQTSEHVINSKLVKVTTGKKTAGTTRLKVVRSDGVVVGIQMIGTDSEFDEIFKTRR